MRHALLLVVAGLAFGQGTNTVFQQMATNASTVGATATVRTVGQGEHIFYIRLENSTGGTCPEKQSALFAIEGSFDNKIWFRVQDQIGNVEVTTIGRDPIGNIATSIVGVGAYPYIRLRHSDWDTTNCRLHAWYSGTLYPASVDPRVTTETVFTLQSASATSPVLRNIGQSEHSLQIFVVPGGGCVSWTTGDIYAVLQGLSGAGVWQDISRRAIPYTGSLPVQVFATGKFAQYRVQLETISNCRATIVYNGFVHAQNSGFQGATYYNQGLSYYYFEFAAGTNTIANAVGVRRQAIYGASFANQGAAASTVSFVCGGTAGQWKLMVPAGSTVIYPLTGLALGDCTAGAIIQLVVTGGGPILGKIWYRYE